MPTQPSHQYHNIPTSLLCNHLLHLSNFILTIHDWSNHLFWRYSCCVFYHHWSFLANLFCVRKNQCRIDAFVCNNCLLQWSTRLNRRWKYRLAEHRSVSPTDHPIFVFSVEAFIISLVTSICHCLIVYLGAVCVVCLLTSSYHEPIKQFS